MVESVSFFCYEWSISYCCWCIIVDCTVVGLMLPDSIVSCPWWSIFIALLWLVLVCSIILILHILIWLCVVLAWFGFVECDVHDALLEWSSVLEMYMARECYCVAALYVCGMLQICSLKWPCMFDISCMISEWIAIFLDNLSCTI